MKTSANFSNKKRFKSFIYAFSGIRSLLKNEPNARIHLIALVCVIGLGIFFKVKLVEWIAITIVSGLVILAELINTAVEQLADFVEPGTNEKIGRIKDYCAGAVLVSAIISLIVGGLIFLPRIIEMVKDLC